MIPFLFICKILLLGFSIAQALAIVQVYISNSGYYTFLISVQEAGYLAVPNEQVFSTLRGLGPAFGGGLFFTFTAGAALTIIASGLAWAWDRLFSRNRFILVLLSLFLLLCLLAANLRGFSFLISGYLLAIPVLVFPFTLKWLPQQPKNQNYSNIIYPVIPFLMLTLLLLWKPSIMNPDRLLSIRDNLLLSNAMGRKVNAFYYENSLYTTRVLRSPGQQLIKSCRLEGMSDPSLVTGTTRILVSQDYLPLENIARPDLRIIQSGQDLEFYDQDELVLKTPMSAFFHNPANILKQYEVRTDRPASLLIFTLFSLFFVGALLVYLCIYAPFYFISGFFLKSTPRAIKAGILWPMVLVFVFLGFRAFPAESLSDPGNLSRAMTSEHLHSRIRALKYIHGNRIDIATLPSYQNMLKSLHVPERYWLAKALGGSRTSETGRFLHQLLDDQHFNVVCMAFDSLGQRGNRADIRPILGKISASENWYEQWYAYQALRRLGWRQKGSEEEAPGS